MTISVKLPNYPALSSRRRRDRQQVNDCKDPACSRMTMEWVCPFYRGVIFFHTILLPELFWAELYTAHVGVSANDLFTVNDAKYYLFINSSAYALHNWVVRDSHRLHYLGVKIICVFEDSKRCLRYFFVVKRERLEESAKNYEGCAEDGDRELGRM